MANPIYQYGKAHANMLGGEAGGDAFQTDFLTDTIKAALLGASYTPNFDTHEVFSDISDELTGTGYVAGGLTVASKTITYTAANSWGTQWAVATAYAVGDIVRPTAGNNRLYRCIVAGTSHGSTQPTWPTVSGQTVVDNTVTWAEIGRGVLVVDCADFTWGPPATISGIRYCVIYRSTGTASTSPLLFLIDLADGPYSVSGAGGQFAVTIPVLGLMTHSTP